MTRQFLFATLFLLTMWRFGWQIMADNPEVRVIYGDDDRQDFLEEPDSEWRQMARSTVALFDQDHLIWQEKEQAFYIDAEEYGLAFNLCKDEPFYNQPTKAFCSGFLIDKDIIVTAGHCLRNSFNCERVRFVFDYSYRDSGEDPLLARPEKVFTCQQLLFQVSKGVSGEDFAIVQLDRPVTEFKPLRLRTDGNINAGDSLTVIGYPEGLPGKIAHQGQVRNDSNPVFFVADLDAFGGSSGSAVFNSETGLIEGLLVRGEKDFSYNHENGCYKSYHCPHGECRGEDVIRISEVIKFFEGSDLISRYSH